MFQCEAKGRLVYDIYLPIPLKYSCSTQSKGYFNVKMLMFKAAYPS